ncbi:MAG: LamG-like jellyroll fold domain-containing protein [Actinomycetota bacterium]
MAGALPLVTKGCGQGESPNTINTNYWFGIDAASNKLVADFEDTAGGVNHPAAVTPTALVATPGVWHHGAVTYDGSTWRFYLDGQFDRALSLGGSFIPESLSAQHAAIGSSLPSTGGTCTAAAGFFQGVMDEVRIWNVVRSQSDIQSTMNQELESGTGLRGRWGLNEGSGTVANDSTGSTIGTLTNGPAWVVGQALTPPPVTPHALQFVSAPAPPPAPGQYVTFGAAPGLASPTFTLETWFKRTGTGVGTQTGSSGLVSSVPLISKGRNQIDADDNRDMNYFLGIDTATNALAVDFEEGPGLTAGDNHPLVASTPITLNVWHHAAATYDGTTWKIYLDGRLDASNFVNKPARGDSIQHAGLGTAMDSTGAPVGFFEGLMDEARIWNFARTGAQIRTDKDTVDPSSTTGLLGQWHLDESAGNSFADASDHGNTGTGNGGSHVAPYGFLQDSLSPASPTGFAATPDDGQVALAWNAGASEVAGYDIYRATFPGVSTLGTPVNGGDLITDNSYIDTGRTNGTQYFYKVVAIDRANNRSGDSNEANATPVPGDPVLVGAGDIANCGLSAAEDGAPETAALIAGIQGSVFTAGDNVYDNGLLTEFQSCYEQSWGAFKNRTSPAPGNHDYGNGGNNGGGYFDYFNGVGQATGPAGDRTKGYYSYDIGDYWHIVVLNSECYYWDICAGGPAAQEAWLEADLTANASRNVFAFMHKPRWSSGNSYSGGAGLTVLQPLWQLLYDHGAEALFVGHDHHYERFAPQDADGQLDNSYGVREFIVGMGGAGFHSLPAGNTPANSEFKNATNYGVMKLVLHQSSYDWRFVPVTAGALPNEFGTVAVHGPPPDTTPPVVDITGVNPPALQFDEPSTDVTWEANESGTYSVRVGGTTCGGGAQGGTVVASGSYTAPNSVTTTVSSSFLADGDNTIRVCVTDGNTNTGSDTAIVSKNVTPPPNALSFDGSNDYVDFGPATGELGASTFTLETWFKRTGAGTSVSTGSGGVTAIPLITKGRAQDEAVAHNMNYFLGIRADNGHLIGDFEDTSGGDNHPVEGVTPIVINSSAWHHAAATYDGTTWRLYLDGKLEIAETEVGTPESNSEQHAALGTAIGTDDESPNLGPVGAFAGVLDEVRIWGVARSGAQIRANKNVETLSGVTGLLGQWHLNQTTGTQVLDASGNNVTGTLSGALWVAGYGFPQDITAPAAPAGVAATAGDSSALVDWNDSAASDLAGYNIWRGLAPSVDTSGTPLNGQDLLKNSTFSDTGLANDTTYYYAVQTVDTSNNSSSSSEDSVVPADTSAPVVTIVGANPASLGFGDTDTDITWHADENGPYSVRLGGADCTGGTELDSGTYSASPNNLVTNVLASALAEGNNTIRVCVTDAAQTGSDTIVVPKNSTPPTNGLTFDGVNDYVDFGPATSELGSQTFTIETWFKRTGAGVSVSTGSGGVTAIPLVTKGVHEDDATPNINMNYFLGIRTDDNSNHLVADFEDTTDGGNHPISGTTAIPANDNIWHHAAAVFDNATLTWRLYLDGVLETRETEDGTPEATSIQHAAFGTAINSSVTPVTEGAFQGVLDEVRIWNVARTGAQIRANKNSETPTPNTGLRGHWHLNQTSGSPVDSSTQHLAGTLSGATWTAGNAVSVDTTAPAAPTGLDGTPDDQQITLTWDANAEPDIAGYDLYRGTSPGVSTAGTPVNGADLITGTTYVNAGLTNGTTYYYKLIAVDSANNRSTASLEDSAMPVPGDPQIVGAGDIADCNRTQDTDTAALINGISGGVFTLGDNVYQNGQFSEFTNCYAPNWGAPAIKSRTRPAPGNHDYANGTDPNTGDSEAIGQGYFDYFNGVGQATGVAGNRTQGYYSYDVGPYWHIVVANSECYYYNVCGGGSIAAGTAAQESWLRGDLAANPGKNVFVMMHKPRWSSGTTLPVLQPLWQIAYDYGVEAVFAGHDHHYEVFAPQNAAGGLDTAFGVRQFIVGTGGAAVTNGNPSPEPNSQAYNSSTYGVMKLKLHQFSYDWQFIPTTVGGFANSGTQSVHSVPSQRPVIDSVTISPTAPTTNQLLTATVTSHDPNGGTITYAYQWLKGGVAIPSQTGSTLNLATAGNGDRGDVITVRVTGSDETGPGSPVTSSGVTVANSPPSATVSLSPDPPGTNAILTATATKSDADNNTVTLTYIWKTAGVVKKTTSNSASLTDTFDLSVATNGDAGQTVSVEVTPNDGTASGTLATDSVVVASALASPTGLTASLTTSAVVLDWANNTEPNLAGYNVYRSTTSPAAGFTKLNSAVLTASAYNDTTALAQTTSYYQVKAVDTGALESGPAAISATRGIAFRSASSQKGSGSSLTVARPAGIAANDVLLAVIDIRSAGTITPPAGWTLVRSDVNGTALKQSVYVHNFQASDPAYTWTFSGNQSITGAILAYAGVNTAGPIDVTSGKLNASSTSISTNAAITADPAAVVGFFGTATNATITPPGTMAEQVEVTASGKAKLTAEAADVLQPAAGSTGAPTAGGSVAAVNIGQIVALRPSDVAVPPDTTNPDPPTGLTATASGTTVNLSWVASHDNVGVHHYDVFRDGAPVAIASPTGTTYADTGASPNATHSYTVNAVDAADNSSTPSNTATVTTSSIIFHGVSTGKAKNATTLSLAKPANTAEGDVLIASVDVRDGPIITPPAGGGWALVRSDVSGTGLTKASFSHVVGASDPGPYVWTFSSAQTAAGTILAYGGVDTTAPILAHNAGTSATTTITSQEVTATTGSVLVSLVGVSTNAAITPPAGQTERAEVIGGSGSLRVVSEASDSVQLGGPTGDKSATGSKAGAGVHQLLLLKPAP